MSIGICSISGYTIGDRSYVFFLTSNFYDAILTLAVSIKLIGPKSLKIKLILYKHKNKHCFSTYLYILDK